MVQTTTGNRLGTTPLRTTLDFPLATTSYTLQVSKDEFAPSTVEVRFEPRSQTSYNVTLDRVAQTLMLPVRTAEREGGRILNTWTMQPVRGWTDTREDSIFASDIAAVTRLSADAGVPLRPEASPDGKFVVFPLMKQVTDPRGRRYGVAPGQTLESIAAANNVDPAVLVRNNGLPKAYVKPGQTIMLPTTTNTSTLWRQDLGGGLSQITSSGYLDGPASFMVDAPTMVFSSNRFDNPPTLTIARADGAGGTTFPNRTQAEDFAPSAAPDMFVYASNPPAEPTTSIWTVGAQGRLATRLTEGTEPCVDRQGKTIAFVRRDPQLGVQQIWSMNIDGTGQTRLTDNRDFDCAMPAFSPDGRWIAYTANMTSTEYGDKQYDLFVMRSDGTRTIQLTVNPSHDDAPSFAPDGRIYFRSNRGGNWQIWRLTPVE